MSQTLNEVVMLSNESGSFPLLADIQYLEPYTSSALNRKLKGILRAGIYAGFQPKVGSGLSVIITSTSEKDGQGAASINVGKSQISIQQVKDVIVPIPASKTSIIALEANFEFGKVTNQVDSSSTLKAAHIVVVDVSRGISDNQLELCRVNVPMDAKAITESMIDTSHRLAQTVGITLSEKIDSDEEGIAANPKAVNVLRKTLLGDAPDGLNTIGQLAQAIGGNKNFIESISTALLEKMSKSANGADIPDKNAFINNLGLRDTVNKAENAYNKAETDHRVNDVRVLANEAKTAANNANSNANGRVPDGRKVNGKALTNDIALNAGDVGAYNRAETDSRVNDVRVLASEAKNTANSNANGRVPAGRKVNGKALTNDIALNAGDVGAYNRAETDSRVNDVRVLASEAKTAANNANSNANGRVPAGRKVNGKALTNDITLNAGDIGAYSRAETDSHVDNVRVLVNEVKNAANNSIDGIRLSAFRIYSSGKSQYADGRNDPTRYNISDSNTNKGLQAGFRKSGEIMTNITWQRHSHDGTVIVVDSVIYASIQYLINGYWVTVADDRYEGNTKIVY